MNRKEAYSLSSKIFNVVCLIFGYYFLATPLFYKLEKRLVDGVPTTLKYQLSGYQLLSSDDLYVTLIIILFLTILSFAVIFLRHNYPSCRQYNRRPHAPSAHL